MNIAQGIGLVASFGLISYGLSWRWHWAVVALAAAVGVGSGWGMLILHFQ